MAHGITADDEVFAVREAMWHGLGTVLEEYPTRAQAQKLVHDWEPMAEPVYRRRWKETSSGVHEVFEEIAGSVLQVRSDNDAPLGVTSDGYTPASNTEMWDLAEALEGQDPSSVMYETAGSLLGGRKVWILVRLREPLIVKGDPHGATIPYYALQNAHDGSASFRGQCTMTRIVCMNTAQIADLDASARGTEFVFRHTASIRDRIADARIALAGWRASIETWQKLTQVLINTKLSDHAAALFIERFIPMPAPHTITERVVHNVENARKLFGEFLDGPTCEGINRTAYGLTQAAVEYLNWGRRAQSTETRFKRTYLDRNAIVTDALNLALEVAEA